MAVIIGDGNADVDYTANSGVHDTNVNDKWPQYEKTIVVAEPGTAFGTLDVAVQFLGGTTYFSLGSIDFTAAIPMEIEVPGIEAIRLTADGSVAANYGYQILGVDL